MEEEIITQMGLLLTQMRFTRRALEDIERNTAAYQGIAFTSALAAGPRFGAPPLLDGALKVYVVNINDLAEGGGIAGFLEGLLGGAGRFLGGLFGGLVGGTIGGAALPYNLAQMARVAEAVDRILARLGAGAGGGGGDSNLPALLDKVTGAIRLLTALFESADREPAAGSGLPSTETGRLWLALLREGSRIVDGLVLLVPILIGALASLIVRLDLIKLAVVDLLQFALRNVFLLRGAVLVTLFDTLGAAARLAARLLNIVADAVNSILGAVFRIAGSVLETALTAFRFLGAGLKRTIDALTDWLRDGLGNLLIFLGDTRIFRLLFVVVRSLPGILPALYRILTISKSRPLGASLPPAEAAALRRAAGVSFPGRAGGFTGRAGAPTPFPDLGTLLLPPSDEAILRRRLTDSRDLTLRETRGIFGTAAGALDQIGDAMREAVTTGETDFFNRLQGRAATIRQRAEDLASALTPARDAAAAAARQPTGLEAIARAYERWLGSGGMTALLDGISRHFERTPTGEPGASRSLPGRAVSAAGPASEVRATVEIDEMVIDLVPAAPEGGAAPAAGGAATGAVDLDQLRWQLHELEERGWRPDPTTAFA